MRQSIYVYFIFLTISILCLMFIYKVFHINKYHKHEYSPTFSKNDVKDFKKGQHIMTDMLREFNRICRKYNIHYWCVGGTLIGVMRNKGWVPWDGDIDIGMLDSDYRKLKEVVQKELPKDYWFQDKSIDKHYKSNIGKIRYLKGFYDCKDKLWHNGLQLDIFIFKKKNDKLLSKFIYEKEFKNLEYNMIFPLKEFLFEDINVYVPNKLKMYSKKAWGSYPPKMPDISERYPHEGRIGFKIPKWIKKKYPSIYQKDDSNVNGNQVIQL